MPVKLCPGLDLKYSALPAIVNYNGQMVPSGRPLLDTSSIGFRYGEGIFETIKVLGGRIAMLDLHVERLFAGIRLLQFRLAAPLTIRNLEKQILELCDENGCLTAARVRLVVFQGSPNGKEYAPLLADYVIESWPLDLSAMTDPYDGLAIDIFPAGKKSMDEFSNLKSTTYLIYSLAARWAYQQGLDECLVLNAKERICDASIANIFAIKGNEVFTPALTEGGIAGVMRKFILAHIHKQEFRAEEIEMNVDWLQSVDEIFLTNALRGIRPVRQLGTKEFPTRRSRALSIWLNKFFEFPQPSVRSRV